MNPFKGRHFQRDIILWAVRWYCKYGISYRELQEMLAERGVNVDHSTIYRWVQRYAPEMEKRPRFINTDKAPAYGRALALLKREGRCPSDVEHRQIKYRNNVIECDHGKLKRIINATLGFKSMKTAYATIKGIEVMRALRKGQASAFYYGDPLGEMRLVSRVFEM
ncbi:DDE-type integrase/transposase/recombinase [Acinetobacter baumannii]|uniref:DDE-type integrase/transposase/recombinase n=1 Tax=Acinetobacter baumannii TaxID=470 RepID=UPI00223B8CDF|nr:DDE-type integrase/transposase/recombinase [Acinetobacter baumannii]MCT2397505.1 DDE-type integrase/transposase/recombinase [Acinetobacter baumannii]